MDSDPDLSASIIAQSEFPFVMFETILAIGLNDPASPGTVAAKIDRIIRLRFLQPICI
ncbi:MAG: hypothetical protein AB7V13_05840 [Pseudorhodoplanes sp.]|uniref:hypothetical protein n=1 Tax=Pseudorhodoplanes sp. TaxID=1934341 RepID=UPI003D0AC331